MGKGVDLMGKGVGLVADKTMEAANASLAVVGKGVGAVADGVGAVAEKVLPQFALDAAALTKEVAMERLQQMGKSVEEMLKDPAWKQARARHAPHRAGMIRSLLLFLIFACNVGTWPHAKTALATAQSLRIRVTRTRI